MSTTKPHLKLLYTYIDASGVRWHEWIVISGYMHSLPLADFNSHCAGPGDLIGVPARRFWQGWKARGAS